MTETEICLDCDKKCSDHLVNGKRIEILEQQYTTVEKNTVSLTKLATKVSILLTVMSFIVILVSGGVIYTFTGLSKFKDTYNEDRIELYNDINHSQDKNRELIQQSIYNLERSLNTKIDKLDSKIEKLK